MREKASAVEDESRIFEEKILLYRKHVTIDDVALAENDDYPMPTAGSLVWRSRKSTMSTSCSSSSMTARLNIITLGYQ